MENHNPSISYSSKGGFALLMALITVTVVSSIGVSLLSLSTKQVRLSTNAKDSEIAFHAANAGIECGRYIRRVASTTMESGGDIPADKDNCFGVNPYSPAKVPILDNANGKIYLYIYGFTWGTNNDRCSFLSTLVMAANSQGSGLSLSNVPMYIPGYPSTAAVNCRAGERCSILSSHGYNRACSDIDTHGTVEREVLIQF
jgi:Tfp pilus assembly protein PilX